MKIITVTLNPAYDVHYTVDSFRPFEENYASGTVRDCGGKGINISKMLNTLSVPNTAYAVLGSQNASFFSDYLKNFPSDCKIFYTGGSIRENITLHSPGMRETRISADNFSLPAALYDEITQRIIGEAVPGTIVAFSGRIPRGISVSDAADFLCTLRENGVLTAVDSNSFSLDDLIRIKPWFIKPNEQEIKSLYKISSPAEEEEAALRLNKVGIENVMISLGERGCVFAGGGRLIRAAAPQLEPLSTIGAGDSTVAGFVAAFYRGLTAEDCVRYAISCGSAACTFPGTRIPNLHVIEKMYAETQITKTEEI